MDVYNERSNSIKSDHIEVCKFDSQEDDGYKKVIGYIRDILEKSELPVAPVTAEVDRQDIAAKRVKNLDSIIQSSTSSSHCGFSGRP